MFAWGLNRLLWGELGLVSILKVEVFMCGAKNRVLVDLILLNMPLSGVEVWLATGAEAI